MNDFRRTEHTARVTAGPGLGKNMDMSAPDVMPVLSRGSTETRAKAPASWSWRPSSPGSRGVTIRPAPTRSSAHLPAWSMTTPRTRRALGSPLIPSVIGLTSDDPQLDVRMRAAPATAALPVAPAGASRVLAVGVLVANRVLDDRSSNDMCRAQPRGTRVGATCDRMGAAVRNRVPLPGCVPPSRGPDGGARLRRGLPRRASPTSTRCSTTCSQRRSTTASCGWAGQPLARGRSKTMTGPPCAA